MREYRLSDFDYELPGELIAQKPLRQRDHSRMLVLDRRSGSLEHSNFFKLPDYLRAGDLLVMNNTRVIPARLKGRRAGGGAAVELLLLHRMDGGRWTAMVRPGRKLRPGTRVLFDHGAEALIEDYAAEGQRVVSFSGPQPIELLLPVIGDVPLPPYIKTRLDDPSHYQTIYAAEEGSAAAPTAGFHFTPAVFDSLQAGEIAWVFITLHIGPGTFQPVKAENIENHVMHREYYRLDSETAAQINATRKRGGRIVAVGTTATRVLETAAGSGGFVESGEGWTDLFIRPGYSYRAVDVLLTNFHLPRSTLLMLVSAFAGHQEMMEAYQEAVRERYRFYSFGDCMLVK